MNEFTKLNVGDVVASGSGKAFKELSSKKVETSIIGTWKLNPTIKGIGATTSYTAPNNTTKRYGVFYGINDGATTTIVNYPITEISFANYLEVDYRPNGTSSTRRSYTKFSSSSGITLSTVASGVNRSGSLSNYSESEQDQILTVVFERDDFDNVDILLQFLNTNGTKIS